MKRLTFLISVYKLTLRQLQVILKSSFVLMIFFITIKIEQAESGEV